VVRPSGARRASGAPFGRSRTGCLLLTAALWLRRLVAVVQWLLVVVMHRRANAVLVELRFCRSR